MKYSSATAKRTPSAWRDMQRDWQRWSHWERRTAAALGFGTLAAAGHFVLTTASFIR